MALVAVLVGVAVLLLALVILRRKGRHDEDYGPASLDFAANLVLAVYLLVLAYAAVLGNDAIGASEADAAAESESLTELYWSVAPIPEADPIRAQIREYTTQSINLDWPLMTQGEMSPVPDRTLESLRASLIRLRPAEDAGKEARSDALSRVSEVSHARSIRADDASSELDPIFMISMVVSGLLVVGLPWLAGVKPSLASVVSDMVRTGVVVIGIVIIMLMAHPFSGPGAIQPDAFAAAQEQFNMIDQQFPVR